MNKNYLYLLVVLVAGMIVGGCETTYEESEVIAFLREPRSPVSGPEYRVMPPDVLVISSQHVAEINEKTIRVRPDGIINLPLLGEIYVANKTPTEIEADINAEAAKYYKTKQVDANVTVAGFKSQRYYVMGHVFRPGPKYWNGSDTLLDALAAATPTNLAWEERVLIIRSEAPARGGFRVDPPGSDYWDTGVHPPSEDRPRHVMTVNLMAMMENGDLSKNILIRPNDIIYVQPTPAAKAGLAIREFLFPVQPLADAVSVPMALVP